MTIRASINFGGSVNETGFTGVEFASSASIPHTIGGISRLTADTTPDGTALGTGEPALTAGAYTIDLTSTAGINTTVSGSGLRVRFLYLKNTGVANLTFSKGASNGYAGLGASFSVELSPGKQIQIEGDDASTVIGGSNKTIDVAGTGTDTFQYAVIFG